ncbi:hypothetical protein T265_13322 [Opisthorchis viverrini]|uniref:Uncharacterized protein n=1 Tax=Opisthorchis viverrini TaxID=6198 RepID=A0A074ZRH9_OPIVI|nr:hypothetical protein T265_13322 [Opisthorchis viverrini]KER29671.1 hypothetical protein T265_13322 [Opisthorchis viverrini]
MWWQCRSVISQNMNLFLIGILCPFRSSVHFGSEEDAPVDHILIILSDNKSDNPKRIRSGKPSVKGEDLVDQAGETYLFIDITADGTATPQQIDTSHGPFADFRDNISMEFQMKLIEQLLVDSLSLYQRSKKLAEEKEVHKIVVGHELMETADKLKLRAISLLRRLSKSIVQRDAQNNVRFSDALEKQHLAVLDQIEDFV